MKYRTEKKRKIHFLVFEFFLKKKTKVDPETFICTNLIIELLKKYYSLNFFQKN